MRAIAMAAALAAAQVPVRARADELRGIYNDDGALSEVGHAVSVTRQGRVARFTVTSTLHNRGAYPDEASLTIDLPTGGVVRGQRLLRDRGWVDGVLLDAGRAEQQYGDLVGGDRYRRNGPALLAWEGTGQVALS